MALETIGFRAAIENLNSYLGGVNQMTAANNKLILSEIKYQETAATSAANISLLNKQRIASQEAVVQAVRSGQARINEFRLRSDDINERLSQRQELAQAKLATANRIVSDQILKSGQASIASLERQAAAEINLANIRTNNAARLAAVSRARGRLEEKIAGEIAAAELSRLKVSDTVTLGIIKNQASEATARLRNAAVIESVSQKERALLASQLARNITLKTVAVRALNTAYVGLNAASNLANTAIQGFGRSLIAVTGFANRFAVSLRFGVTAIAAFSTAFAISEASQFENALLKINVLTDATTEETSKYREELLELSKAIPKSPDELGAGLYFILSSGVKDAALAFDILEIAAKASVAGLGEVDDITRVATQTINAYGKENLSASQAIEILFATAKEGSAEVEDLVSNIGRVVTPAAQLGVEFDELGASVAALTNAGLPARQAITAILGIFNQLLDPSAEAANLLEDYGTSIQQLRLEVQTKGLIPAMKDLLATFDGNREVLTTLFPEIRGLVGIFAILSNESELYNQALNGVIQSQGVVDDAFKKASETFSFQAGLLKNLLNRALISLGADILPTVTSSIQNFGQALQNNQESIQEFLRIAGLIVEFFIAGAKEIHSFAQSIVGNQGIIIGALIAIGAIIAAVIGPIPLLVLGAVAAIGVIATRFEELKAAAQDLWGNLPGIIKGALEEIALDVLIRVNGIIGVINGIVDAFNEVVSLVKNIANEDWPAVWEDMKDIAAVGVELMNATIEAILGNLRNIFLNAGEAAINAFNSAIETGLNNLFFNTGRTSQGGGSPLPESLDFWKALGIEPINIDLSDILGIDKVTIPEVNLPEFDVPELPDFTANVRRTREEVTATSDEFEEFGEQVLPDVTSSFNDTKLGAEEAAKAAEKFAQALKSALSDGIVSFAEATELGLDAITAGALEAAVAFDATGEQAFELEKAMSRVANAFAESREEAQKYILALAEESLAKARAAADAVLGAPTREEAVTRFEIAQLERELARQNAGQLPGTLNLGGIARSGLTKEVIEQEIQVREDLLDSLRSQKDVLSAAIDAADQSLLTQAEAVKFAGEAINNIKESSKTVRAFSDELGIPLSKEVEEMRNQMELLNGALLVFNNADLRATFERDVSGYIAAINALDGETEESSGKVAELGTQAGLAAEQIRKEREQRLEENRARGINALELGDAQQQDSFIDRSIIGEIIESRMLVDTVESVLSLINGLIDGSPRNQITPPNVGDAGLKVQNDEVVAAIEEASRVIEESVNGVSSEIVTLRDITDSLLVNSDEISSEAQKIRELLEEAISSSSTASGINALEIEGNAAGGLITKPTISRLGENYNPELVLPLSEPSRSKELLMSLPPSLAAQIGLSRGNGASFESLVSIGSIQGIITPEIEHMVHREVRRQLTRPRAGLKSIGL